MREALPQVGNDADEKIAEAIPDNDERLDDLMDISRLALVKVSEDRFSGRGNYSPCESDSRRW